MWNLKEKKLSKALTLTLALILIGSSFAGCGKKEEPETTVPTTETTSEAPKIRNPLTGKDGYDKTLLNNRPIIISVENHPSARPQWGLCSSDLVMEMVAEGGITRMLLMYSDASRIPEKVGPVRSARHYFVELVEGFDAIFVHWGGSSYAYSEIRNTGCNDLDGKYISSCFFRDKSRNVDIEHTGYTTGKSIVSAIADKKYETTLKDGYSSPFKFNEKGNKTLADGSCVQCTISFSGSYTYTYSYDKQENKYFSSLNGKEFVDSEGKQQNFTNLIILYTTITDLNDVKNRVTFDLSEGHGTYVSNGTYEAITWKKGDNDDMLKLYDKNGDELKLNIGRSYIAFVGKDREAKTVIA